LKVLPTVACKSYDLRRFILAQVNAKSTGVRIEAGLTFAVAETRSAIQPMNSISDNYQQQPAVA
jgi:hypothetical protein